MAIGSIYDREDKEAVESLINTLKRGDGGSRVRAARALGMIGDVRAVEPLIQALKDEDVNVRIAAAEALGSIKDARAVEPLIQALKDGNWSYRVRAARALGMIGDVRAVEPLIQALKDECYRMEKRSIENIKNMLWALEKIGEPAVESLVQALKDKNGHFRWGAASALEKIGWLPKNTMEKVLYLIGKSEWDDVAIVGKPAVESLIQALNDSDSYIRMGAARALGKIGDLRAVEPLVPLLREKDPRDEKGKVLGAAAEALDRLGWKPENDLDRVYYLMAKGEWEKLAELGKVAVEPLLEALHYGWNYDLRVGAAKTLGMIGDRRAVEPLLEIICENEGLWDSRYRCVAAVALARISDGRAVEFLRRVMVRGDEYLYSVRLCAARALNQLGWTPTINLERVYFLAANNEWDRVVELGEAAIGPLIEALTDPNDVYREKEEVQLKAVETLYKIGLRVGVDRVIPSLAEARWKVCNNRVCTAMESALDKLWMKKLCERGENGESWGWENEYPPE